MSLKEYDYRIINEFKNTISAKEIKLYLYKMPVRNLEEKYSENGLYVKELKIINPDNPYITFKGNLIASFYEIKNWTIKYDEACYRVIDLNSECEKNILEQLIHEDIKLAAPSDTYYYTKKGIVLRKPISIIDNIHIKRMYEFDVNIEGDGEIIIGYEASTNYSYKVNILYNMSNNTLLKGDTVQDIYNHKLYEYVGEADFTINDKTEDLSKSIIDYYNDIGEGYKIKNANPNTRAVYVKSTYKGKEKMLSFSPTVLRKYLPFQNAPEKARKYAKLTPTERINDLTNNVKVITSQCKFVKFKRDNRLLSNLGYKEINLNDPALQFGNNRIAYKPYNGLISFGSYESGDIPISYFIDPNIIKDNNKFNKVKVFSKNLETFSNNLSVKLTRTTSGVDFKNIDTSNESLFERDLRKIVSNYNNACVFIMTDENTDKYYNSVKKVFGNKHHIPTQFIALSNILNLDERSEKAFFMNVLLGIYGKCRIKPWVLKEPLHADCFIGLDVSRENGVNAAGIVQVVGKNGQTLRSKVSTSSQRGETINPETIKDIVFDAIQAYSNEYNEDPKHIVFHRDGISREQLEILKSTTDSLGITFDFIEIAKRVSRRVAKTDLSKLKLIPGTNSVDLSSVHWKTDLGDCYIKGDMAYLVSTNPKEFLGMAQPIRIKKVYGDTDIEDIVRDVYNLSFMHIGSIIKCRLPITTHYADLSSTYGNRGLIPTNMDGDELHFI